MVAIKVAERPDKRVAVPENMTGSSQFSAGAFIQSKPAGTRASHRHPPTRPAPQEVAECRDLALLGQGSGKLTNARSRWHEDAQA